MSVGNHHTTLEPYKSSQHQVSLEETLPQPGNQYYKVRINFKYGSIGAYKAYYDNVVHYGNCMGVNNYQSQCIEAITAIVLSWVTILYLKFLLWIHFFGIGLID